jgi:hypothetical protein
MSARLPGSPFLIRILLDSWPGDAGDLYRSLTGRPEIGEAAGWVADRGRTGLLLCGVPNEAGMAVADEHIRSVLSSRPGSAEVTGFARRGGAAKSGPSNLASADTLFTVHLQPSAWWRAPLAEWLHGEHFARQTAMPGVAWGCGYESVDGPATLFNLWSVATAEIIDSPEWLSVRNTPWWDQVSTAFSSGPLRRATYHRVLP